MSQEKRVAILCVDDTESSKLTVKFYIESLANENDEVYIVSVFDPPSLGMILSYSGPFVVPEDYEERLSKEVETQKGMLYSYKKEIEDSEKNLTIHCKLINPHEMEIGPTLLSYANEMNADFIVVGSKRAGLIRRVFMGSISNYLMHNSKNIPVIVGPRPIKH